MHYGEASDEAEPDDKDLDFLLELQNQSYNRDSSVTNNGMLFYHFLFVFFCSLASSSCETF